MFKRYFGQVRGLVTGPEAFFASMAVTEDGGEASRFSLLCGVVVALLLALQEVLGGGTLSWVLLVAVLGILAVSPVLAGTWTYGWTVFLRLCASLLGESLPFESARRVVAYSTVGLIPLGVSFSLGAWLALSVLFFQVLGLEKLLGCSRFTAFVLVGFPFCVVAVVALFFTFMFKVF